MAADGRFGGHIVAGHIDGTGTIRSMQPEGNAALVTISAAPELLRYVVEKGSIAIDGISLTVAKVSHTDFTVSLIPHTGEETALLKHRSGEIVDLETDIIGKYVEKLMQPKSGGVTMELLQNRTDFFKGDTYAAYHLFSQSRKRKRLSQQLVSLAVRERRHFLCPHGTVHDVPESPAISGYRNCTADCRNDSPGIVKALGRSVRNYVDSQWSAVRQQIVYEGLLEKFRQNQSLLQELLATAPHLLAECAVHDRIWGIGLSMTDSDRLSLEKWRGQNLLGYTLMQVRDELSK